MTSKFQYKKGDKVKYEKEIMFKGTVTIVSKVIAIISNKILLENGDEITVI